MATTTVTTGVIGAGAVAAADLADDAVTYNKLNANTAHTDRNQSFSVAQRGTISALGVQTSTVTLNMNNANHFSLTANGNITIANPTNTTAGQSGSITVVANGSYTTSFGSHWRFATGSAPTLSTVAAKQDRIDYYVFSSNTIHAVATIDLLGTA